MSHQYVGESIAHTESTRSRKPCLSMIECGHRMDGWPFHARLCPPIVDDRVSPESTVCADSTTQKCPPDKTINQSTARRHVRTKQLFTSQIKACFIFHDQSTSRVMSTTQYITGQSRLHFSSPVNLEGHVNNLSHYRTESDWRFTSIQLWGSCQQLDTIQVEVWLTFHFQSTVKVMSTTRQITSQSLLHFSLPFNREGHVNNSLHHRSKSHTLLTSSQL